MSNTLHSLTSIEKAKIITMPFLGSSLKVPACPLGESTLQTSIESISDESNWYRIWEEKKGDATQFFPKLSEWQADLSSHWLVSSLKTANRPFKWDIILTPKSHMQLTKSISRKWPHVEYQLHLRLCCCFPSFPLKVCMSRGQPIGEMIHWDSLSLPLSLPLDMIIDFQMIDSSPWMSHEISEKEIESR